jgi:hypothetical protein
VFLLKLCDLLLHLANRSAVRKDQCFGDLAR